MDQQSISQPETSSMREEPVINNSFAADEANVSAVAPTTESSHAPLPSFEPSSIAAENEVALPSLDSAPSSYNLAQTATDFPQPTELSSIDMAAPAPEPQPVPEYAPAPAPAPEQVPAPSFSDVAAPVAPSEPQSSVEQPIEHSAPGISSVADFLPPSHEPAQPVQPSIPQVDAPGALQSEDAVMTDSSADIPNIEVAESQPIEAPVLEPAAAEPVQQQIEPVQQHTPAPDSDAIQTEAHTESAQTAHAPSVITPEPSQPSFQAQEEPKPLDQPNGDASVSTPVSTQPAPEASPSAPSVIPSTETQPQPAQPNVEMADNIVVGTTRPREDDDEAGDEPFAKRSRVEDEPATETATATEEFKRPEVPAQEQPISAAALNGTATATSHLPPRANYSTDPLTPIQRKTIEDKLKNTKKIKSAALFLRPVDHVALNIPNYPVVIKQPMDLGTMEGKLKANQYDSLEHFVTDFELMVNNCFTFNGPAHPVSVAAQNLRAYFLKQMDSVPTGDAATAPAKAFKKESPVAKPQPHRESRAVVGGAVKPPTPSGETFALLPGGTPQIRRDSNAGRPKRTVIPPPSRDLPYSGSKPKRKENMAGLKFCEHVLSELRKPKYHSMTMYFLEPVDPVALNIPHYYKVIKHPMDIQTITNKYKNGQYSTAEEFKADFDLIFENCYKFNPPDNAVHLVGKQFQSEFDALWRGKNEFIKKHQPRSQRHTPASDDDSDSEESSDGDGDDAEDEKEETIRKLKEQLAAMQNMLGSISGGKRDSPKASSKKKNRSSSGVSKSKKKESKSASKSKSKKQRLVTYDEKQEISNATEQMTAAQIDKLTTIITENVSKYKDMAGDDVELEIDDLPNEVQHMLLKYVRSIFPRAHQPDDVDEFAAIDDDYEPSARARAAAAGPTKKKHRPMKKADQERRIAELMDSIGRVEGTSAVGAGAAESSGDEDSESSEEE